MKVVHPLGRKLSDKFSANFDGIMPRACQCSDWDAYAANRGASDDCEHCGCQCSDNSGWLSINNGNRNNARDTDRASG